MRESVSCAAEVFTAFDGKKLVGTVRMGDDPRRSVLNRGDRTPTEAAQRAYVAFLLWRAVCSNGAAKVPAVWWPRLVVIRGSMQRARVWCPQDGLLRRIPAVALDCNVVTPSRKRYHRWP